MSEPEFTLYYWPGFAGRAEFIRLMFAIAAVPFRDLAKEAPEESRKEIIAIRSGANPDFGVVFAPPFLKTSSGLALCQTSVIVKYIAKRFGFSPADLDAEATADMISACVMDYLAEGRSAFHPKEPFGSYSSQVAEAAVAVAKFTSAGGRFSTWLSYFERALARNGGGRGFFVGDALSYADVTVLHAMRASESQFPEAWAALDVPVLKAWYARMTSSPRVAEYIATKATPFAGDSMM